MLYYQIFCANCGQLFVPSDEQKFLDRSAVVSCCSKNCLKIHNYKYSAWISKKKLTWGSAKELIISTIKIIGNIPEVEEILKLAESMAIDKFSSKELLFEILSLIKDDVLPMKDIKSK